MKEREREKEESKHPYKDRVGNMRERERRVRTREV